jgi:hypothetical protein
VVIVGYVHLGSRSGRANRIRRATDGQDVYESLGMAHRAMRIAAFAGMMSVVVPSTPMEGARASMIATTTCARRSQLVPTRSIPAPTIIIIHVEETMKQHIARALLVAITLAVACSDYSKNPTYPNPSTSAGRDTTTTTGPQYSRSGARRVGFGFNGTASGFPIGAVFLTGGGSYDPATASNAANDTTTDVKSGGGFRCIDGVGQGPLNHCLTDEGVRWDTAQLLESAPFKCTATDAVKNAVTGPGRAVLQADFYRAGDGIDESFTAQMIVSETDLAPNIPGEQTLWIQGVGCAEAKVNFNQ